MQSLILPNLFIVYQDDDIVAVYKPAGLVVHRCDSTPEDEVALLQVLRDQIGRHVYPVHRIDQPTSGIVLYGLSSSAAASLVDQFTNRRILKCYQAVVIGHFASHRSILTPLSASENFGTEGSPLVRIPIRNAETQVRALAHFAPKWNVNGVASCQLSLVEATPHTGRWHQIRRHLRSVEHPVLGDRRHGDDRYNDAIIDELHSRLPDRMMLNASYIQFRQPTSGKIVALRCDPDPTFQTIVQLLGEPLRLFHWDDFETGYE